MWETHTSAHLQNTWHTFPTWGSRCRTDETSPIRFFRSDKNNQLSWRLKIRLCKQRSVAQSCWRRCSVWLPHPTSVKHPSTSSNAVCPHRAAPISTGNEFRGSVEIRTEICDVGPSRESHISLYLDSESWWHWKRLKFVKARGKIELCGGKKTRTLGFRPSTASLICRHSTRPSQSSPASPDSRRASSDTRVCLQSTLSLDPPVSLLKVHRYGERQCHYVGLASGGSVFWLMFDGCSFQGSNQYESETLRGTQWGDTET